MASRVILALLFIVGVVSASRGVARVVGGSEATIQDYPMTVQVESLTGVFWAQSCAGSILTSRYIISAAQCFSGVLFTPVGRRVRFGSSERNTGGETSGVQAATNHPDFRGSNGLDSDISLVRLSTVLSYTEEIQPGTITTANSYLYAGVSVNVVGWGNVENGDMLQVISTSTLDLKACGDVYSVEEGAPEVTENMMCLAAEEGAGTCAGDIGGPVLYPQDPQDIIVGIVSWGNGCGNSSNPVVATALTKFTDWIIANAV